MHFQKNIEMFDGYKNNKHDMTTIKSINTAMKK